MVPVSAPPVPLPPRFPQEYLEYYENESIGGIVYLVLVKDSLHRFGEFLCVIFAITTVAGNIPNMYSIALNAQAFWSPLGKVPRIVWTLVGNGIVIVLSIVGYNYFQSFLSNFMSLVGYYLSCYIGIAFTEHFVFRKGKFENYDVENYDNLSKLNPGYASAASFFVGVAGIVLGMDQTWFCGSIAKKIGGYGGDIAFELGMGFSLTAYLILRPLELKKFGH